VENVPTSFLRSLFSLGFSAVMYFSIFDVFSFRDFPVAVFAFEMFPSIPVSMANMFYNGLAKCSVRASWRCTNRDIFQLLYTFHNFELLARAIPERNFQSDWAKSESIRRRDAQKNGYHYVARPIIESEGESREDIKMNVTSG
jgi:hypothetical protein